MTNEQALNYMHSPLRGMLDKKASDLFISADFPPAMKNDASCAAIEILPNSPLMADLILKGKTNMVKEVMAKSVELGMQTFDQALFRLAEDGRISQEDALRNADSINELRLRFKLHGKNAGIKEDTSKLDSLSLHEDEPKEEDATST